MAEPFVETPVSRGNPLATDAASARAGLSRRIAHETADMASLVPLVKYRLGVAIAQAAPEGHPLSDRVRRVTFLRCSDQQAPARSTTPTTSSRTASKTASGSVPSAVSARAPSMRRRSVS